MVNSTLKPSSLSSALAESPMPLYLQLADIFRDRIVRREWPAGSHIPTLEVLAEQFGVARVTVRQAVQLLTKEGLLVPRRGAGTIVNKTDDAPTSAKMLTFDESHAMPKVDPAAGKLGKSYVFMRRLHFTEGKPYALISLYLLQEIFQRAPESFRTHAVIPELLRMKTVRIHRAHQTMSIGSADTESARLLHVRAGTPVAHVTRVFVDARERILYYAEVTYRGDWVKWEIDLQV
jgi:GntR family transcriptional regulator